MKFIEQINIPNRLTLIRILLVPFFMVVMFIDNLWTRIFVFIVFIIASITDLYDGKIARKYKQVSKVGIFIDPIADKILISAALIFFVQVKELNIPAWMIVLIISREYIVTGLRLIATIENKIMQADYIGKFKTTSQIIVIITILAILIINSAIKYYWGLEPNDLLNFSDWKYYLGLFLLKVPFWLMLVVTLFTVYSGISYFRKYKNIVILKLGE